MAGTAPTTYILDNERSNELEKSFVKDNLTYHLPRPNCHRTNKAERAIQTFKNHFKAGIATTDPNFPSSEWDCLIVLSFYPIEPTRHTHRIIYQICTKKLMGP